jgi:integrase
VRAPKVRRLSEKDNVRTGFLDAAAFRRLLTQLPNDGLRDFVLFGYLCGWRKGSIASLRWEDVDLDAGEINLPGQFLKNGDPLTMAIAGELADVMARRKEARAIKTNSAVALSALVFHRYGAPVNEFRKAWASAAVQSGLAKWVCRKCQGESTVRRCPNCKTDGKYKGTIFHDLRRSSARDLIRSGVEESVAMRVVGHKSTSMFQRYNITDSEDVRAAMLSVEKYRKAQEQRVVAMEASR